MLRVGKYRHPGQSGRHGGRWGARQPQCRRSPPP